MGGSPDLSSSLFVAEKCLQPRKPCTKQQHRSINDSRCHAAPSLLPGACYSPASISQHETGSAHALGTASAQQWPKAFLCDTTATAAVRDKGKNDPARQIAAATTTVNAC